MFCISINHKNTPADVRESFAFSTKGQRQFTEQLKAAVGGCVVLSTCNRMEIYFTDKCEPCGSVITGKMSSGEASGGRGGLLEQVEMLLANDRDVPVSLIRRYSMNYEGFQCMLHLCRVACGMDSMVLGEVEIIHQVKSAYLVAKKLGACDGELNIAFQGALAAAKAVATESDTTRLPVSVGTLSAREAVNFTRNGGIENTCRDVRSDVVSSSQAESVDAEKANTGHILVVGATGKIGSIVVKDIADLAPDIEITGTSRSHHSADSIFDRHQQIRIEDYSRRYELAAWADVIISATASPHYTFVRDEILFGYNVDDSVPASRVLRDGYGQCNTKGTLFMALLRACDIPCRVHGFTIDKKLQKGAMTGIVYRNAPQNVFHSWVEVYFENRWYELEAFILDMGYLKKLQAKYSECTGAFCGFGVAVKDFKNPVIDFDRNNTYIQSEGINQDFGVYDSPDELLKEHHQEMSRVKAFLYRNWGRHMMNRNVRKIRGK